MYNFNKKIRESPGKEEETQADLATSEYESVVKPRRPPLQSNFVSKENHNRLTHILVELEIDKDIIGEMSFSLKESQSEKERFSSSMFNLKHFFGNKNRLANVFELKLASVYICEPFQYKTIHLNAEVQSKKNCFLGLEVENILSRDVCVEIVDSDVLIEVAPELVQGKFVKVDSNLLDLVEYVIYNKNKVVSLSSFEKSSLVGRLTIRNEKKTDNKYTTVVESCHFCSKKSQIINEKSVSRFSKKDKEKSVLYSVTGNNTGSSFASLNEVFESEYNAKYFNSGNSLANSGSMFKKNLASSSQSTGTNTLNFKGQGKAPSQSQCKCCKAQLNYSDSKLKLVFVAHVRFADGASSLIKSESTWKVRQEEQVSMQMNLTKKLVRQEVQSFKGVRRVHKKTPIDSKLVKSKPS